jgi:hypothetical protein
VVAALYAVAILTTRALPQWIGWLGLLVGASQAGKSWRVCCNAGRHEFVAHRDWGSQARRHRRQRSIPSLCWRPTLPSPTPGLETADR